MRDLATALSGRDFAVAGVIEVSGSAPRGPSSALAVTADGEALGSVSVAAWKGPCTSWPGSRSRPECRSGTVSATPTTMPSLSA
jgi:hypothetical protein